MYNYKDKRLTPKPPKLGKRVAANYLHKCRYNKVGPFETANHSCATRFVVRWKRKYSIREEMQLIARTPEYVRYKGR